MSVEHVAALLKTDVGFEILSAIMGEAEPAWWLNAKLAQGIRQSKRAIAMEMKRSEKLRAMRDQLNLFDQ